MSALLALFALAAANDLSDLRVDAGGGAGPTTTTVTAPPATDGAVEAAAL